MNILCVIDSLGAGGAQRQLVNLAIAFKEKGHNIEFLVYHKEDFYYKFLEENEIRVIEVLEKNYIKRILKMRRIIRNGNYDSILSFLEAANFISTIASFPYRKWSLIVGERSANPNILISFKLRLYRWFHLFVTSVVANSHENIKLVKQANPLLKDKKLHVIYNLIDLEKWKPHEEQYTFRENNKFNLIVVASHQYLKNLNGLVEAVKLLSKKEKDDLIIHWYGGERSDNSKKDAMEKIRKYSLFSVFKFHNSILDIETKVNKADALGLFSFYEGLPNVVCEAMVNKKAIISSDVSDIKLFIDNNFIFDPNLPQDIAQKISLLMQMNEKELNTLGEINRKSASILFDKERIINSYISVMSKK